jgi:cytochrome c-type biogenesis protein CcmF
MYPLLLDALGLDKLSVGPPYFEAVFVPLMVPVVALLAFGPLARWKQASLPSLLHRLRWAALATVLGALATGLVAGRISPVATLGFLMAYWVAASIVVDALERLRAENHAGAPVLARVRRFPRALVGMWLAHLGVAAFAFGVSMVRTYEAEQDLTMAFGSSAEVGGYRFQLDELHEVRGPNYEALQATMRVTRDGREVAVLHPEKRVYRVQRTPTTEAAIQPGVTRDLYVSLGEMVKPDTWTLRIHVKPFVDWIWGGCLLMALGGAVALSDRRYRRGARRTQDDEAGVPVPARPATEVAA